MKKYLIFFSGTLLTLFLVACNGGNGKTDAPADSTAKNNQVTTANQPDPCEGIGNIDLCEGGVGIANLIVSENDGRAMMNDFIDIYRRDDLRKVIHALDSTYWLSSCAVFAIESHLRNSKNPDGTLMYDGIRIHLACEVNANPGTFPGQQYQNQSTIFIFPTTRRKIPNPKLSDHVDHRIRIPLPNGCSSRFIEDDGVAGSKIEAFKKVYRLEQTTTPKKAFSKSIWLEPCVVYALASLLRLPTANLDGVNINLAAYSSLDPQRRPSQEYLKQSTVILIPTSLKNGKHEDNWSIVDCLEKYAKANGWAPPGGFNHGELCPQKCD